MQIKQWEDKNLAHFSYAVLGEGEKKMVLIDPARNPEPYLSYAKEMAATIIGIIETHPHADFISGHLELSKVTGAPIYTSRLVGASYPHIAFDGGDTIAFGGIMLSAINTPGHSPDSITVLLEHNGKQHAVFSGDTLFIGDCGRPDLREAAGNQRSTRLDLAKKMYHTLREKFVALDDKVILYPAHGAGTLCGKGLSEASSSTMGHEKNANWSLQQMTEDSFVKTLLSDQPFIPAYFPFDVELNRKGAPAFIESINAVPMGSPIENQSDVDTLRTDMLLIDARNEKAYKENHLPNSINLMEGAKFETWLGSIIQPGEKFYLGGDSPEQLESLITRAAVIGYEPQINEAFVIAFGTQQSPVVELDSVLKNPGKFTIVDVRNSEESATAKPFKHSLSIPLPELRQRLTDIPLDKPIVVHCAGGYRSAAGSSIIQLAANGTPVFDLGESIKSVL